MDDPLRPKAVPLAAETVLWFEFLLDPNLLIKHLGKQNAEPTPIELINQFIAMSPETLQVPQVDLSSDSEILRGIPATPGVANIPPSGDVLRLTRKQYALKILTVKVATFLRWDLDLLEKELSFQRQIDLLRDLCTIAFGKQIALPITSDFNAKIAPDGNEAAAKFALAVYHRWALRFQIIKEVTLKSAKPPIPPNFVSFEWTTSVGPDIPTQPSIDYLTQLCQSSQPFYVCTNDTFVLIHQDSDSIAQNFKGMKQISLAELRAQIYFDLANFYLFTKQNKKAQEATILCQKNFQDTKYEYRDRKQSKFDFCHLNEDELTGYLIACGVSDRLITLNEKFSTSLNNQYKDIVEILKVDNKFREIPIVSRRIAELDIEGAISQGILKESRELEMKVAALNVIRDIFEEGNMFSSVDFFEKYRNHHCFSAIAEGIFDVLPHCSLGEKNRIKEFVIDCVMKNHQNVKLFLQVIETFGLFSTLEIEDLKRQITEDDIPVPTIAAQPDWKLINKPRLDSSNIDWIEVGTLERQLISCTNANSVRKLLVKLAATNPAKPLFTVNPSWQIPTPINTLLMSMPRGFMQDFAYVLLGKAREMSAKNDYVGAVSMLSVLKSETQRHELSNTSSVAKLGKMVNWEILFIQICQCLEEWNKKTLDMQSLGNRCKQCLSSLQNPDNVIPRIEIIEHCSIMLLNLSDWTSLMFLDKRLPQLELPLAFAATFLDMEKMKGSKKVCRDAWDLLLPMFSNQPKRNTSSSRNSPSLTSTGLQTFLKRIRDQGLFSLVISLLGKIHNILKDDPNYELNGEYMQLWPTSISNPLGYSNRLVSETLNWLLKEGLKYYPQHLTWLKMKGDVELAIGNNEAAMRCYVNALISGTEYCTISLLRVATDDYVIRKMIRCCSNLGCYMQAAVLCQFLDDIDYSLAFKNLTEKSSNFTDAMDAYYGCIWDTTLLEFIVNLHAKKGEFARKLEAIGVMSALELNANNNEEIKREAAIIRKSKFLRALAKQYLL